MSSRRITSFLRDRTVSNLIKHRFESEQQILEQRSSGLARLIYNEVFDEDTRLLMASLPEGWLPTSSYIHVTLGGKYESICLDTERPFPYSKKNQCVAVYDGDHSIVVVWCNLVAEREELRVRIKEAKAAALAILDSVTMTGALVAKWPEVAPFLPPDSMPETLPAVPIDSVNKLLGLESVNIAVAS